MTRHGDVAEAEVPARLRSDPSRWLRGLLPDSCSTWARTDDVEPSLGVEPPGLVGAVPSRVREFATTRWCARKAQESLGEPPRPVLRDPSGAPVWPTGLVGSLTHCRGLRAAAVARARDVVGIGIDAEVVRPLRPGVRDLVATAQDEQLLRRLERAQPQSPWDLVLFSAKESVYKLWWPSERTWLDFSDVSVGITADGTDGGRLTAVLPSPVAGAHTLSGRWSVHAGFVLTAFCLRTS